MKSKEEIKRKLDSLLQDMSDMHTERNEKKEKYGGVSEEENEDFFTDLSAKHNQSHILKWVLGIKD
tara:strand:- start:539 stop:736 length:198 start_codon:yes stop_codon:yes gene_type:complete